MILFTCLKNVILQYFFLRTKHFLTLFLSSTFFFVFPTHDSEVKHQENHEIFPLKLLISRAKYYELILQLNQNMPNFELITANTIKFWGPFWTMT